MDGSEECDDGYLLNGSDDSYCASDCTVKTDVYPPPQCFVYVSDNLMRYSTYYCIAGTERCGNGVVDDDHTTTETCDDMNDVDNDGCTAC